MEEFLKKCALIEEARIKYPEFDEEFKAFLGAGNGFNGAYNHFTVEDIAKYEVVVTPPVVTKVVAAPVVDKKVVEKPSVTISKPAGA